MWVAALGVGLAMRVSVGCLTAVLGGALSASCGLKAADRED